MKPGEEMRAALKRIAAPYLRSVGFRGSFPRFHRVRDGRSEVVSFQFSQRPAGQFTVNLAWEHGMGRTNASPAPHARLTPDDRFADHWFVFDAEAAAFLREMGGVVLEARTFATDYSSQERFDEVAQRCVEMLRTRGDPQLASFQPPQGSASPQG